MRSFATEAAARLEALRPASQDILQGRLLLGAYGRPGDELERFCKEWSMDRAVADGMHEVSHSNVPSFPSWLRERLEDPYLVPLSRLVAARRRHGVDMALDGLMMRWPQEVSWAGLARLIGDPEATCLAQVWLKSARADPGKAYLLFLDAMSSLSDPSYLSSPARNLSPHAISCLPALPDGFVPVWRRMCSSAVQDGIRRQGEARVAAMAARIREAAQREEKLRVGARAGKRMEAERPHMRISILAAAAEIGLVSDELLAAFHSLLEAVRAGTLNGLPHHALAVSLPSYIGSSPDVEPQDACLRRQAVSSLGPTWLRSLPADWQSMMDGRASSPATAGNWIAEIEGERRRPPLDPMLDYGLWLAERRT